MAHWAQIDENNIVIQVTVGDNNEPDEGYSWLIANLGGRWIKTSYNTYGGIHLTGGEPLRKNYAGIGYTYDETRDAFIPPQPFQSWTLNNETCVWEPPTPCPGDMAFMAWDETNHEWIAGQ
jgi:hypothetical protein